MTTPTRITHLIGHSSWEGTAERTSEVYNPATGEVTGTLDLASKALVDEVVAQAAEAAKEWGQTSIAKRTRVLFAFRELLESRKGEIAKAIVAEHGKTYPDAVGEINRGLEVVEFACGIGHIMKGGYSENVSTKIDAYSILQPLGVVGVISPFNFPAMVPLWFVPVAIACGNAVVIKPSEKDPTATGLIADLWREAGLPDGVMNVVHGDKEAVDALLDHPDVKAISFVGSTPIARYVYERGVANGKRVQALGGAKNHMVVMPDADLDTAADAAVSAAYGSAGERCMAVSVLVAVGEVADPLIEKISDRVAKLQIGDGTDPASEMGPLITADAKERVAGYVASAEQDGATVVVDGRAQEFDGDGFFLGVSLVDHVRPGMAVYDDEIFGPVLSVVRVDSYDEAVELINANRYANGVAVFTRDGSTAREFEMDIEVGMVGVNVPIPVPIGAFSFGGWKDSLFGDTHIYAPEAFDFYTRRKVITSRWPQPSDSQVNLGFPTH